MGLCLEVYVWLGSVALAGGIMSCLRDVYKRAMLKSLTKRYIVGMCVYTIGCSFLAAIAAFMVVQGMTGKSDIALGIATIAGFGGAEFLQSHKGVIDKIFSKWEK